MKQSKTPFKLMRAFMTFGGPKDSRRDYGLEILPGVPNVGYDFYGDNKPDEDTQEFKMQMKKKRQMLNKSLMIKKQK